MRIFIAFSAISLTGVFAIVLAYLHMTSQSGPIQDECLVSEKLISYRNFKTTLTAMLERLTHGNISLEDARDRVYESASRNYPPYIAEIAHREPGATPHERVARNLIGHLHLDAEKDPALYVRIFALEIEFATLQRKDAARAH